MKLTVRVSDSEARKAFVAVLEFLGGTVLEEKAVACDQHPSWLGSAFTTDGKGAVLTVELEEQWAGRLLLLASTRITFQREAAAAT